MLYLRRFIYKLLKDNNHPGQGRVSLLTYSKRNEAKLDYKKKLLFLLLISLNLINYISSHLFIILLIDLI